MLHALKKINLILYEYFKFRFIFFIFLKIIDSILKFLSLASIAPIILVFFKKDLILENKFFFEINKKINFFFNESNLEVFFSIFFIGLLILGSFLKILNESFNIFYGEKIGQKLKLKYFKSFLNLNLNDIVAINKSNFESETGVIISKISEFGKRYLNFLSNSMYAFLLTVSIFLLANYEARLAVFLAILLFLLSYYFLKKFNKFFFQKEIEIAKKKSKITNNISFGFFEVILNNLKNLYLNNLNKIENEKINISIKKTFVSIVPKIFFETIFLATLVSFLYFYDFKNFTEENLGSIIFFVITISRLIPTYSTLYSDLISMNMNKYSLFYNLRIKTYSKNNRKNKKIYFRKTLKFKADFTYDGKKVYYFDILIKKSEKILLKGISGCGKTTLLNLITGILRPNFYKKFKIDNVNIENNIINYWKLISYLNQDPMIFEGSVLENITFFEKKNKIDYERLEKVLKISGLKTLYKNLDNLENTNINMDTKQISGGQRQRIFLCRALYKKSEIYIFDEALNQLDRDSEIKIYKEMAKYFKDKTFLVVSHRSSLPFFNKIVKLR